MATLQEILTDKTQYPDDVKISLVGGTETTLGDLRKGHMMEADYRRKTSQVAEERRRLEAEKQSFEAARIDAETKLTNLASRIVQSRGESTTRSQLEEELESNPVAKALAEQIKGLTTKIESLQKNTEDIQSEIVNSRQASMVGEHRRVLNQIKAADPDLDEAELIHFARSNYVPRLDLAYRLFTEDKRLKNAAVEAAKKAREEGIAEGKRLAITPTLPNRLAAVAPILPEDAPKTFDEARDRAVQDPEIISLLAEEIGG